MIRRVFDVLLLALACPTLLLASQDPAANPPSPSPQPPGTASNPTPAPKARKVWTNEDVRSAGSVSVVGDQRNQKYTMTKHADAATIQKYKTNLQKLEAQLLDVNKQLKAFQDFAEGKPVTEAGQGINHGYIRVPVNQQTQKLLDKKKDLEQQIDDLYESARKNGIESGELK